MNIDRPNIALLEKWGFVQRPAPSPSVPEKPESDKGVCMKCGKRLTAYNTVFHGADKQWGVSCVDCAESGVPDQAGLDAVRVEFLSLLKGVTDCLIEDANREWEKEVEECLEELVAEGRVLKMADGCYRISKAQFILSPA